MRKVLILSIALGCAGLASAPAHAQSGTGVALRWNHCYGEGTGLVQRTFACDTNDGIEELVGSFGLAEDLDGVTGNEMVVDVTTAGPPCACPMPAPVNPVPLPEWWKFKQPGTCRQTSLSVSFVPDAANQVCQDWGSGLEAGGIASYSIEQRGPGTARILIFAAMPLGAAQSLQSGMEYYSFTLRIRHDKTVGSTACAGCEVPLAIFFNSIKVTTGSPANDRVMSGPLNGFDSEFVVWGPAPVAARSATWAALKSRYR